MNITWNSGSWLKIYYFKRNLFRSSGQVCFLLEYFKYRYMTIQGLMPAAPGAESYLSIVANTIGRLTLKVFDTNGRIAKKICKDIITGVQQLEISLGDLSDGTYILNAFNGDTFIKSFRFTKE